ncbi:MAG: hypothetical protein KGS45_01250 [Planctomycetes bacterium]|nr:hypothetical protein [Planctomycetota bacterium]
MEARYRFAARVVNGRINSTNSGVIEFDSMLGDSSIGGTQSMNADARILSGATLGLRTGTLTNSGSLKVNDAAGNSATTLTLETGSMTLTGSGEVWLNGVATNLATAQITAADAAYVLTNDTNHTIRGIGTVTAAFTNLGTIRADGTGAILTLESTAVSTNSGTISAPTGTTLRVANMQLNQSGGVVLADAGSAKVRGSSIYGGNVHAQNGGTVDYVTTTSGNPLLSNVNLSGNQYVLPGTTLMANTAITNNSTLRVGDGTSSDPASIEMDTLNVTLGGTGTVQLRDSNLGPDTASIHASQTTSVLTNGVNHTIRGNGEINVFNIVNRGQIIADVNDRTLDIYIDDITNHGLLQATAGGSLNLGNCTLVQVGSGEVLVENNSDVVMPDSIDGGSVRATGTGRIRIINDLDILSDVTFVGEVSLSNSTVGWINTISVGTPTTVTNQGKIIVGDAPGTQPCEIRLTQSGPSFFNGQGAIILDTAIPEAIGNAKLVSSVAGAILVNRTNHTIRGRGVVDVEVSNEGTIAPGLVDIDFGIGELNFGNVELDLEPSSRLRIEIAGNTLFDKISGNADVTCDGEMFVNLVNGYQPTAGQEFRIIRGTTRTGTFDTVHLPTLNDSSLKWLVSYIPAGVTLKVVCGADFNSDGVVDFFDYLDFVAEFSGATVSADFNNDAVIDFFDYLDFVAAFSGGC